MKATEGKIPLREEHFYYFAAATLKAKKDLRLNIFAHSFLTITWALVARSASTALAGWDMFDWEGDSMTLVLPKSKSMVTFATSSFTFHSTGNLFPVLTPSVSLISPSHTYAQAADPSGKDAVPKHIFASQNPAVCPILGLAVYLFTLPTAEPRLFGKSAEKRFRKWFQSHLKAHQGDLDNIGIPVADLGAHSFRKVRSRAHADIALQLFV